MKGKRMPATWTCYSLIPVSFPNASRLSTVVSGDLTATYSYLANSPLVEQITFQNGGTTRMTTAKQYDYLNRLTGISSTPSASSQIGFSYGYNQANQRTNVTLGPDGSSWAYGYDKLGQVTSGKKYWKDGTPVAGEQFEYAFDDIGNRLRTKAGGDSSGGSLRVAAYTNNLLNQITGRDVPGTNDIIGIAHASATVTVNGTNTYRKGEFYQQALIFTNRAFSLYPYITNMAVMAGVTNSTTGRVFVARSPEVFSYDADGNLTNDGRWVYIWDGENRLTRMVSKTNNPAEACFALDFAYDARGRRISKTVSNWTGSAWSRVCQKRFVYDGWNLLAVLDSDGVLAQSFVSGLDLSGSMQGAGGVGGLLAINDVSNGVHCVAYDGNGNVMGLVSATDGSVSANYEYGPFGEVLRATGPMAKANPFRFSTKYQDDETDLLYYDYRYYSASTGRWLGQDPVGERGGLNLYGFNFNDGIGHIDSDGRQSWPTGSFPIPSPPGGPGTPDPRPPGWPPNRPYPPTPPNLPPPTGKGPVMICIRPMQFLKCTDRIVHCFMDFGGGETYSYDDKGVHTDPEPNSPKKKCTTAQCPDGVTADDIRKKVREEAGGGDWSGGMYPDGDYRFFRHNCCHFVDHVLKSLGCKGTEDHFPGYKLPSHPDL